MIYVDLSVVCVGLEIWANNSGGFVGIDIGVSVGFLVDNLTSVMLVVVSFVSLMVHIYTIGYMSHTKITHTIN
jgi:NADH:ubiquinone oxidoreductase subunit 5 (subunit L)/multisubunit Na+/H+ antiporter MnhA subunit